MNHPIGRPADDPDGDAAVARVNALRAARGVAPIVERDPAMVRRELVAGRDAIMLAVAVLHRPGCGATVPDAIDSAMQCKPALAAFDLPPGVALAILRRTPDRHAPAVFDALDAELLRFSAKVAAAPDRVGGLAHLSIDRLHAATRTAVTASIADELSGVVVVEGVPITRDMVAQVAEFAAGIALGGLVERLRDDLLTMAGMP